MKLPKGASTPRLYKGIAALMRINGATREQQKLFTKLMGNALHEAKYKKKSSGKEQSDK